MKRSVFLLLVAMLTVCLVAPAMAQGDPRPHRDGDDEDYYSAGECDCDCEYCYCNADYYDENYDYEDDYDYSDDVCDCDCEYCDCGDNDDYGENQSWIPEVVFDYAEEYGTIMIVDLDDQFVFCCVEGEIVAYAECVSGDLYDSPTPTGLYEVWDKQRDYYMMDDIYCSEYAIFYDEETAILDADDWRDEYGGEIYQGDGSYGCVDVPEWFAEVVYMNTDIGTPIYVF